MPKTENSPAVGKGSWTRVGTMEELKSEGCLTGRGVAVFLDQDELRAVDNRCPHMGFPLSQGQAKNGLLTCPWHAWQFDLKSGGCLTPAESDVAVYPAEDRNGEIWVDLSGPSPEESLRKSSQKLETSLKAASTLEASKAVYRLFDLGTSAEDILGRAAELGVRSLPRFSAGLTGMTALGRVMTQYGISLDHEQKTLALLRGVGPVAQEALGTAPRRMRGALPSGAASPRRLKEWFLGFLRDREVFAAERTLRSLGEGPKARRLMADFVLSGATEQVFCGTGHVLDFTNKALELLDLTGWERAPDALTSLLADMAESTRHQEDMAWKHPVDLISMIRDAEKELRPERISAGEVESGDPWEMGQILCETSPEEGFVLLIRDLRRGVGAETLCRALAAAAVLRVHRFHTRNEFFDWDTVHHLLTHANALLRLMRRQPSADLARGIFHLYGYLHLTKFLNIPRAKLPEELAAQNPAGSLASLIETRQLDGAAVSVYQRRGEGPGLAKDLVLAAIQEDHGFHTWQHLEASLSLHALLGGSHRPLSSLSRWLAAHSPTPRALTQTVDNAVRLEKGEHLYEDGVHD